MLRAFACGVLVLAMLGFPSVQAQPQPPTDVAQPAEPQPPAEPAEPPEPQDVPDFDNSPPEVPAEDWGRGDREVVSIGHDSVLTAGERARELVSIFGSSISAGEVSNAVVSFMGDSQVTGPVGDSVVAVFGNARVNSRVRRDVVAVMGNVELGPQADVGGDVVAVFGRIDKHPQARHRGSLNSVLSSLQGLRPWTDHALLFARPLALESGMSWAWGLSLGFFALYLLFALVLRSPLDTCSNVLETQPGRVTLAAFLGVLLSPVLIVLLCITLVGIALVPFFAMALFAATLFGKAAVLNTIGRLCIRVAVHPAIAVGVGGLIVLALYLVPVVGALVFVLFGMLGFGVVAYTLIHNASLGRRPSPPQAIASGVPAASPPPEDVTPAAMSVAPTAAQAASAALPRAGFWIRMAALLIDAILVGIVLGVLANDSGGFLLLLALYGAVMWKLRGTTIGGIVCNLKVVRLDGRELDWPTAFVRALSCFLSLVIAGLGFLWMIFDPERQTWHDKIAGTVVVRVPPGTSLV